jgi:hypothetical protein
MVRAELSERPERLADDHWATICRLSQLGLYSWEVRRPGRVRLWFGVVMLRAGLRLTEPLTVEALLGPSRTGC